MTNKDAIYYLQYLRHDVHADSPHDIALVTAINALSSSPEQTKKKKLSNADRIRQMTDEDLADFLDTITDCCNMFVPKCEKCPMKYADVTPRCNISEWLKQEVKDDANNT